MKQLLIALLIIFAPKTLGQALVGDVIRLKPTSLTSTCKNGDIRTDSSSSSVPNYCDSNTWTPMVGGGSGTGLVNLVNGVTGVLRVQNGGTNSSSFTAGSVVFASTGGTALTQSNSNFFWDNTTNKLGIGTSSPSTSLHVPGTITAGTLSSGPLTFTSFAGTAGTFSGALTASTFSGNGASLTALSGTAVASGTVPLAFGGTGTGSFTSGSVVFMGAGDAYAQDNASFFFNDSTNRVGIGTASPGVSLDIGSRTDSVRLPSGTTGQRPSGVNGDIRYNTTTGALESFVAGAWASIGTGAGGGSGTVTSVDMSVPSFLTVSGNPITTSGTLAVALAATQVQNTVFAGSAAAGTGIPTFRALVAADIPNLDAGKITSGLLAPDRGGTGAAAFTQGSAVFVDGSGVYAQDNANYFWDDTNNFLGLQTATPTRVLGISGAMAENIGMETNPTALTAGNSLTVNAGGASSGTNLTGGALILASGASTGTAISQIELRIPTPSASGTGANTLATVVTVGTGFTTMALGHGIRVGTGTTTAPTYAFTGEPDTGFFDDATDNRFTIVAGGTTLFTVGGGASSLVSTTTGGVSIKAPNSSVAAPTFAFAGDTSSGLHRVGAGTLSMITLGTERMRIDGGGVNIGTSSVGTSVVLGADSTIRGFLPPRMSTAQRDAIASPATGLQIFNTSTNAINYYTGATWAAAVSSTPTVQTVTSGTGTYTTPGGVTWIKVRMIGAGGGGAASGSAGSNGTGGTASAFGNAVGGGGPAGLFGGVVVSGGTATIGTFTTGRAWPGGGGQGSVQGLTLGAMMGGQGGSGIFGGAGGGGHGGGDGATASTNTGAGGGGAGIGPGVSNPINGAGGASGGAVELIVIAPVATYNYSVGTAGTGAGTGTGGRAGGNGAAGIIIVEENY